MERNDSIKLLLVCVVLAAVIIPATLAMRGINSFTGGIRYVRPAMWYERWIEHPALYLTLAGVALLGLVVWQISTRRVSIVDIITIEHQDRTVTFWSLIMAECAGLALLVHFALKAIAAS